MGMVDHAEMATGGDPDIIDSEEWMVYDERCWFKLLGTQGFGQVHVSVYRYVCPLGMMDKIQREKCLQEMDIGDHILLQVKLGLIIGKTSFCHDLNFHLVSFLQSWLLVSPFLEISFQMPYGRSLSCL